ncbi:MAG: DegT/DnrJ/EryC1/StrS family aminotransferase [Actinobacteria bacterium]|nr:DegT/DnrJ/EryC1/StrS family aminotransferase [Actinomycetota bacterium]
MVPVSQPTITVEDIDAVVNTLREGSVSGEAPVVRQFEESFAREVGRVHGIAVANGSLALDLAVHALDLNPGDEVIVPSFTIASCLFAVLRSRATPVFIDVDPITWNINHRTFEAAITKKTKALIVVHTYGLAVEMEPLIGICDHYGIALIEDSAEAHGVRYLNQLCGSFGLISTFSFYANKAITCGEGGMILTNDDDLAARLKRLRNLSFQTPPAPRFVHNEIGWNARMSAMQASLGLSQLKRLGAIVAEKRRIGLRYNELLGGSDRWTLQPTATSYSENMYWVVGILLADGIDTLAVASKLREFGVDSRPFFFPLHLQPMMIDSLDRSTVQKLTVSEKLGRSGIYLPSYVGISNEQIEHCSASLFSAVAHVNASR